MSENVSNLIDKLKADGFLKKEDLSGLLDQTKDVTISMMLDHKDCGDNNCNICAMKKEIDTKAYARGANDGFKLSKK